MATHSAEIDIRTKSRVEPVDITGDVTEAVGDSGVGDGIVCVTTPHTTTAVYVNEPERGLLQDVVEMANRLTELGVPLQHNRVDRNAQAHLAGILVGNSVTLPVRGGRPELGTWQSIFFLELDGPRSRRALISVVGE
ncbi:MAG: secondary thiamine-phosphate synthase enzyme YjbQ [Armatimonadota bacterium]|jgi:secondary thiamine-phosphate synthase enzyme